MKKFKIAEMVVEIDYEDSFIHEDFNLFECDRDLPTDIYWTVKECEPPVLPTDIEWKDMKGFYVGEKDGVTYANYVVESYYKVKTIIYEDDYKRVTYYIPKGLQPELGETHISELSEYLLVFHQEAFFLAMLPLGGFSIHSCSIIYQNYGVVFSASSQTGKSTHAKMWKEAYGTPILDGDVTLCRIIDGIPTIYGLPWAGTSNMYLNESVELKSIVFLRQGIEDVAMPIDYFQAFQRIMARSFTPLWFDGLLQMRIKAIEQILNSGISCYLLYCTPNPSAVKAIKEKLDSECFSC